MISIPVAEFLKEKTGVAHSKKMLTDSNDAITLKELCGRYKFLVIKGNAD